MAVSRGELGAVFGVVGIFLAIQLGALALVQPFLDANVQAVEDPTNPQNSVLFFGVVLVATGTGFTDTDTTDVEVTAPTVPMADLDATFEEIA